MRVACFTVAAMDEFPQAGECHAGGNALNQSIRFRHLGYDSAFVGALGTDANGDRIEALLQSESVDCSHLRRLAGITACNRILNDEAGERFGVEGAWQNGAYGEFRMDSDDWAYLSHFDIWATHADCPCFEETLARKESRQFLSIDFLHLMDEEQVEKCMGSNTLCYFGGTADMAGNLAKLAERKPGLLVLTLGADGSMAFQGSSRWVQPALPVSKVVDATGCGDAFQAGFTATWIQTGDISKALLAGAEMGRIATQSYGGVPWKTT